MTSGDLTRVALMGALALGLGACTKGGDDSSDSETETETAITYPEATWFYAIGDFAYDANTDTIVSWTDRDETGATQPGINPVMALELYEGDSSGPATDPICTLVVEQTGPITAVTSLGSDTVPLGFKFDWNSVTLTTDCFDADPANALLDPDIWNETSLATVDWGMALTGALTENTADQNSIWGAVYSQINGSDPTAWTNDFEPNMTGGAPWFSTTGQFNSGDELYFARGRAMDGTFTVQETTGHDPIWIQKGDINDGTPPTAVYGVRTAFLLTFGTPLEDVFTVQ